MTIHEPTLPEPEDFTDTHGAEAIDLQERQLVCGYPKTGRTWVRYMLATALSDHFELDIDIDLTNVYNVVPNDEAGRVPGQPPYAYEGLVPKIEMSHRSYAAEEHETAQTIFLVRDPRDVMVSHWLHNQKQRHQFEGDLTDFVHDPQFGIDVFLDHLSGWAPHLDPDSVITYENMRIDPITALQSIVNRFSLPLSGPEIASAVAAGSIDKMRQKEVENGIAGHSYDRSDPEALRVRRGKVGGFTDYMSAPDELYIHERVAASNPAAQAIIAMTAYRPLGSS